MINTGVDGWGGESNTQVLAGADVRIVAWDESYSTADFDSGWFSMSRSINYEEVTHGFNSYPARVKVLIRANGGNNQNFIFYGSGATMKGTTSDQTHGGVIYSYDTNKFKLYSPTDTEDGFLVGILDGWGDNTLNSG